MKSLMSLWIEMAEQSAILCHTSATSDIKTVRRRVEHEGLSFLTITLPDLGKASQNWLDQGQVGIHTSFDKGRGSLPVFLRGFFSRVFDRRTGVLLDNPDIEAIRAIRQLTLSFGKIALPCTPEREREAIRRFVECEKDVRESDAKLSEEDFAGFKQVSDLLYSELFTQMDRDVYYEQILPKHGPGAVADRLTSNGKYEMRTWTARLEEVFPSYRYLIPNHHFVDELEKVDILEPGAEMPVRVISVPKTLKTPRIIAIEPACMQYMQQAVKGSFLAAFERDELLRGLIGFDNQEPNQLLACQGSANGRTATLDLSEASDRVSNQLVRRMVSNWPSLAKAIDATRSRRAEVPGYGVIRLAKYASMGSALCFPMEALVFTTLIFLGIQKSLNTTLTRKDVKSFLGSVRVYGDDLIVPVEHVSSIVQTLEHFGAQVGLDKSFWTGRFRESCGKEYYDGEDVSIVRVRHLLPSTIADVTEVNSTVELRNQLYMFGYWHVCRWLDTRLRGILKYYPIVGPNSSVLGRVSFLGYENQRMHPSLHSPLVRGYVVQAKAPRDPLDGTGALLKCLLKLAHKHGVPVDYPVNEVPLYVPGTAPKEPSSWAPPERQDGKHLERSGRPKRVGIKLGWWPSY
ncbi:RNA-directed RNA polymerase [ssRNA phage Gephyllon.3_15]|uniref:RNA-directed RNA polymerase n=2 Tax=Leviviricetes TaxID=2842243 RepID=A0A8S5KYJ0_9VIRU|nr:RNA-directed RNA polymerase [ssRNA phage Gephyllon.3_15]QDH87074.1 MAG: RNA-dependent RNA polymerase [Leviviridae sp.]DAD50117.1 TPA_asm: RNA-directed RNA polymerase [ssRNA phage Gephyllon.3_15]